MTHDCVDWTATPPVRKTPLLILTHGDVHVYTVVPKDFQTLEDIAKREFGLGDVDVSISSSCVNLCHGQPARITESAWEHLSAFIGCAIVEVSGPRTRGGASLTRRQTCDAKERATSANNLGGHTHENVHMDGELENSAREAVRADATSDHGNDPDSTSDRGWPGAQAQHRMRSRYKYKYVSEGESEESAREHKKEQPYDIQTQTQTQPPFDMSEKLVLRVAHPPSNQESKFTAKGTTKVAKVLAGACRSFGLDVSRATLFLILTTTFGDDDQTENLFRCDENDTIFRAGAERDTESRFLVTISSEDARA